MILLLLSLATFGACMNYSDYLGRNISLPLSAALYSPNPSRCLRRRLEASKVQNFTAEVKGGSCSGLVVALPKNKTVALTFRADLSDPYVDKSWDEFFFPLKEWKHGGKVSKFLADGFEELWKNTGMRDQFQKTMNETEYEEVLVTGHYIGGALAALVAYDIVADDLAKDKDVTLVTLGPMMAGDKEFAEAYEEEVKYSYRVVRRLDLIPLVPGSKFGFAYNGDEVFYDKIGMQVIGETGYKICNHDDCSSKQYRPLTSENNDVYFKKNVTTYGMKCR